MERHTLLRFELRRLELAAHALSPDQRLVLACQIGLQMGAQEFCARFDWTPEKHRKVAQRARSKLRRLLDEPAVREATEDMATARRRVGEEASRGEAGQGEGSDAAEKSFRDRRPVLRSTSERGAGTLL